MGLGGLRSNQYEEGNEYVSTLRLQIVSFLLTDFDNFYWFLPYDYMCILSLFRHSTSINFK